VIEGACRHLVKDRMDVTGARWGLDGAEAILKLRTLISNGDYAEAGVMPTGALNRLVDNACASWSSG